MMKIRNIGLVLVSMALAGSVILVSLRPEPKPDEPIPAKAEEVELDQAELIVRDARKARVAYSLEKKGSLRIGRDRLAFDVKISKPNQTIAYSFGGKQIELDFSKHPIQVTERLAGGAARLVGAAQLDELIEGTDVMLADVAEPFWDWPNPQMLEEDQERVSIGVRRESWVVRMDNPVARSGPYAVAKAWFDKETRTLLRLDAFDWEGRKVSRCEVSKVGKDREKGIWVTEKLRIKKFDREAKPKTSHPVIFEKPIWIKEG